MIFLPNYGPYGNNFSFVFPDMQCGEPPTINHTEAIPSSVWYYNDTIIVNCTSPGYTYNVNGSEYLNSTIQCQADGNWSDTWHHCSGEYTFTITMVSEH